MRAEISALDTRLSAQIAEVRTEVSGLDTRLSKQIAGVRTEIANLETRLVRWMVGTVIATATLTVAILRVIGQRKSPHHPLDVRRRPRERHVEQRLLGLRRRHPVTARTFE